MTEPVLRALVCSFTLPQTGCVP